MKNESFAMLNNRKRREKLIGVLKGKCQGLLTREELEYISDSVDSNHQYSVRLVFDSERFNTLASEVHSRTIPGIEMPKALIMRSHGMNEKNQICILIPADRTKQGSPYVRERI